ncbi:hypothetical protein FQZ97_678540 [compost metagenome]
MDVPVLQLRGGGQQVVGVVGGVGAELLQHHREEVFAREARHHLGRLGRHRHRVAVVDHDGLHRLGGVEQRIADGAHVDGARLAPGQQVGALQRGAVDRVVARAAEQQAARAVAPGADQRRQAGDGARRVAAAAHALHAVVQADRGRLGRAVGLGQRDDLCLGNAADLGRTRRRPLQRALAQLLPAQRVVGDVVVVEPVVHDEFVHERQRQRGVGAGQQRDVLVALVGGFGLARVDAHQPRAGALGGLGVAPEVQVAGDGVAAPDEDELGLGEELDAHADLGAQRVDHGFAARHRADGAVQQRGAQLVEEAPVHRFALHQAHGARIAVGENCFRFRLQSPKMRGDIVQCSLPRDGLEAAAALGTDAFQGLHEPLGMVIAFDVAGHLGAQHAAGVRVGGVALQLHRHAVLDGGDERAGVGAIVRAGAQHRGGCGGVGRVEEGIRCVGHRTSLI